VAPLEGICYVMLCYVLICFEGVPCHVGHLNIVPFIFGHIMLAT
jgi:hypothetical protein